MNTAISSPSFNTILAIAALVLAVLLLYAFIKRLISLIAIILFMLMLYAGYLYFSGQRIPTTQKEIMSHGIEQLEKIKSNKGVSIDKLLNDQHTKK
jgi:hypothetical protein